MTFPSVGRDTFQKGNEEILVSTIYFNLDWVSDISPKAWVSHPERYRYYETIIFGGNHDGYQERHRTEEEAVAEHARAVALVKEELR